MLTYTCQNYRHNSYGVSVETLTYICHHIRTNNHLVNVDVDLHLPTSANNKHGVSVEMLNCTHQHQRNNSHRVIVNVNLHLPVANSAETTHMGWVVERFTNAYQYNNENVENDTVIWAFKFAAPSNMTQQTSGQWSVTT